VNDAKDTHDLIEWVAAQPWCNGVVGTTGLSYGGWIQWAAASQHPPHLKAMISTSAAGRWQQEIPYTNGVFQLFFAWWSYRTRRRILETYGFVRTDWYEKLSTLPFKALEDYIDSPSPTWDNLADRYTLDDFYRALRFDGHYDEIDVPCLHVTGWYDQEDLLGAFHHYEMMMDNSPARDNQYLIVGPWSHVGSRNPSRFYSGIDFGPEAALDVEAEHVRFFDYWLKGSDNGLTSLDRVRLFEPGRNAWRNAGVWPTSSTTRTLHLGDGALLEREPTESGQRSYRYDPMDPVPTGLTISRYPLYEDVPLDQTETEQRDDVLYFTSAPLDHELVISGWPRLELFASSDCDDTDWHVKVTDVDLDGRSLRLTQGCLRAACRNSLEFLEPMEPGETYAFSIELWPTHHVLRPGHSIRVSVTSSDFPWFARSLNQFGPVHLQSEAKVAINTVFYGGEFPSRLVLPVEG
jgi:putative CocE/NonD family hydrolase